MRPILAPVLALLVIAYFTRSNVIPGFSLLDYRGHLSSTYGRTQREDSYVKRLSGALHETSAYVTHTITEATYLLLRSGNIPKWHEGSTVGLYPTALLDLSRMEKYLNEFLQRWTNPGQSSAILNASPTHMNEKLQALISELWSTLSATLMSPKKISATRRSAKPVLDLSQMKEYLNGFLKWWVNPSQSSAIPNASPTDITEKLQDVISDLRGTLSDKPVFPKKTSAGRPPAADVSKILNAVNVIIENKLGDVIEEIKTMSDELENTTEEQAEQVKIMLKYIQEVLVRTRKDVLEKLVSFSLYSAHAKDIVRANCEKLDEYINERSKSLKNS
ncbi:uncharacterized protein LOC135371756 [Ornithodoros turicata]|uniref:uncharacterized protein LOC135371752 n=1 Tax=Ornithodoros turicata TaxID=34597 RepID=UPI003138E0CF